MYFLYRLYSIKPESASERKRTRAKYGYDETDIGAKVSWIGTFDHGGRAGGRAGRRSGIGNRRVDQRAPLYDQSFRNVAKWYHSQALASCWSSECRKIVPLSSLSFILELGMSQNGTTLMP